ncbi:hypothetical protein GCM10010211_12320 [Streptomyces albospinus]|uniref:Uncharacterized protein n=1 Tax=Streptomyces albospinus TaxID=285515 RepID=A0ABQ2UUZ5_9ACTN|nr:hypothetical protein [Streptomyces albospinus]GGU49663.1 hypothetical protein GCM10010211_12320 [Streptomyces albospinus]
MHRTAARPDLADHVAELLQHVGLEADFAGRCPHELSGGQRLAVAPTVSAP